MGFCGKPHIFSLSENILIFTLTIPRLLLSKPKAFISPFTRYKTFVSLLKELLSGVAFFTAKRWYLYITSLCSGVSSCKWTGLSHWINSLFPHLSSQQLIIPDHPLSPIIAQAEGWHFLGTCLPIAPLTSELQTPGEGAGTWVILTTPQCFHPPLLPCHGCCRLLPRAKASSLCGSQSTSKNLFFLSSGLGLWWFYEGKFYKLKIKKYFLKPK